MEKEHDILTKDEFNQKVDNLKDDPSSFILVIRALKSLFCKENRRCTIFSGIGALVLSVPLSFSKNTVIIYRDISSDTLNVLLALFGIIFTAFALLQAYININILENMVPLKYDNDDSTKTYDKNTKIAIHKTNENFMILLMLSLVNIIIFFVLKILLYHVPEDFILLNDVMFSNICCLALSTILFMLLLYNILSLKSVIRDLYVLFNLGTITAIYKIEKERSENDKETELKPKFKEIIEELFRKK